MLEIPEETLRDLFKDPATRELHRHSMHRMLAEFRVTKMAVVVVGSGGMRQPITAELIDNLAK